MLLTLFLTCLKNITSKLKTSFDSHFGAQHGHTYAQLQHIGAKNDTKYENLKISPNKPHFSPHNVYIII